MMSLAMRENTSGPILQSFLPFHIFDDIGFFGKNINLEFLKQESSIQIFRLSSAIFSLNPSPIKDINHFRKPHPNPQTSSLLDENSGNIFEKDLIFDEDIKRLKMLLEACSCTYRDELMHILLRIAMINVVSKALDSKILFIGETCTRHAINLIFDVCCARGVNIPWITSTPQSYSFFDCSIGRPMVDFVDEEVPIAFKTFCSNMIENYSLSKNQLNLNSDIKLEKKSIYRLTEDFILGLHQENPMTASTITRTAGKVITSSDSMIKDESKLCALCCAPMYLSTSDLKNFTIANIIEGTLPLDLSPKNNNFTGKFNGIFCFGCHRIIENLELPKINPDCQSSSETMSILDILPSHSKPIIMNACFSSTNNT